MADKISRKRSVRDQGLKPEKTQSSVLSTQHSPLTQSSVLSPQHSALTQSSALSTQHSVLTQSSVLSPHHSSLTQSSLASSAPLFLDLAADLLHRGHDVRFSAPGRSMYPAIREGETITVRPVSSSAVKVGDIILYRWEKGVIAHRVIRIVLDPAKAGAPQGPKARSSPSQSPTLSPHHLFVLRGDSSGACDERVKPEQILGKVIAVDRNGRRIDLYSIPSKAWRVLHPFASRFKQWALQKTIRRP